jgi:hypothetical protein
MPTVESFGPGLFPNTDDGQTTANTLTYGGSGGINIGGSNPVNITNAGVQGSAATAMAVKSGTTGALTVDSGTTGTVNIGTGANAKAVNIGTGAVANTITIGNNTSGTKVVTYGEIDAGAAAAGTIGEVIQSVVASPGGSLSNASPGNVTSIALTAGDWLVDGCVTFVNTGVTTAPASLWSAGISSTTGALPTDGTEAATCFSSTTANSKTSISLPPKQINIAAGATYYLVGEATFSVGSVTAYGFITARRMH